MTSTTLPQSGNRIFAGHAAFDERIADIVARVRRAEWPGLDQAWADFADDMTRHLDYEEREIFDDYADEAPAHAEATAQLRADHATLRGFLRRVAAEIEQRVVRDATLELFVAELRLHAAREETTVYPWLEQRRGGRMRRSS